MAICGYHGWHDWYLSSNLKNKKNLDNHLLPNLGANGIPSSMKGLTVPFEFNNINNLENILRKNPNNFAAVIIEPFRDNGPENGYLKKVKSLSKKYVSVLNFD